MTTDQYRKVRANQLPVKEQQRLKHLLQQELAEALVQSVRTNPPKIDLADLEVVLHQRDVRSEFGESASCLTCITCVTCDTCGTT